MFDKVKCFSDLTLCMLVLASYKGKTNACVELCCFTPCIFLHFSSLLFLPVHFFFFWSQQEDSEQYTRHLQRHVSVGTVFSSLLSSANPVLSILFMLLFSYQAGKSFRRLQGTISNPHYPSTN